MLDALGIVFILFSVGLFTYIRVDLKKEKLMNLTEMKKAFTFLKHELSFSMPEISLLCKKIAENTTGEISVVFKNIENMIKENTETDFYELWQISTNKKVLFCDEAECMISDFSKNFGKKTLDIELENLKRFETKAEQLEELEKEKYLKEKKLIYTIGTAVCAVIVVLLI